MIAGHENPIFGDILLGNENATGSSLNNQSNKTNLWLCRRHFPSGFGDFVFT